ncbi:hypothetical protein B1L11_14010 [Microbispora sp. GKU 823]|nr:hypothetical protein B1L11_14010 [Microbispora sp. GKU 823]
MLPVSADREAPAGRVDLVEGELADRLGAGGVDGGQGDDQPLAWCRRDVLDRGDLFVGHRQERAPWCLSGAEPAGRVGEDQAAAFGELEQ